MRKVLLVASLFAVSAFAGEMTGVVSEDHCGAKHSAGTEADTKCVQGCMKNGAKAVFVSDGKVYQISNPKAVAGHEGHKVVVTGDVKGDTVTVDSLKMAS